MALMDDYLEPSDGASLITAPGNTIYSDVIDLGAADPNIGLGTPLWVHARIGTAVTMTDGTGTITTTLQHSANASSYSTLHASSALTPAQLTAGTRVIEMPIPAVTSRYLRFAYAVATTACTAGTMDAWVDTGAQYRA